MAKELPYFQFEPAEYLTGDVSFCSLSAQGLFIILCSYYWQRSCKLTKDQFLRRINKENDFNELVDENIIQIENNVIKISFLDEQFEIATKKSKTNSINGKKGGRPKKETEEKPKINPNESETKGIREDNIREDNIREDNIYTEKDFINDWNELRTEILSKPSHIGSLNTFCKDLFKDTCKSREITIKALKGFFKQNNFPKGQDYTLNQKHFLEYFNTYLQAYHDKNANVWKD